MNKKMIESYKDWIVYVSNFDANPRDDFSSEESYWLVSNEWQLSCISSISGGIPARVKVTMRECFQCGALLEHRGESRFLSEEEVLAGLGDYFLPYSRSEKRCRCPGCGWWLVVKSFEAGDSQYFATRESYQKEHHSIVKRYDIAATDTPIEVLTT
jgi:hypothetical protein